MMCRVYTRDVQQTKLTEDPERDDHGKKVMKGIPSFQFPLALWKKKKRKESRAQYNDNDDVSAAVRQLLFFSPFLFEC